MTHPEDYPLVSVVIPCFNEEKHIETLCADLYDQDYPEEKTEIFLIDGCSTDSTKALIRRWTADHPNFHLLDNPRRYVPYALNLGIGCSKGEVIVRMDAHSRYPVTYISRLVEALINLQADNVGGAWTTVPSGPGLIPLAIAEAMSSAFGIGNALYRLPGTKVKQVDTVPFGCFRRDVFDRFGLFDEELIRNQDDEFNARIIKNGGKIFLIPDVRITYYARESVGKAVKMFYQYGLFKPLVNRKLGKPATLRQFVPPAFLLTLALLLILVLWHPLFLAGFALLLCLHLSFGLVFSILSVKKSNHTGLLFLMPFVFLLIHLGYGWGYLRGIFRFYVFRKKFDTLETTR